MTEPLSRRLAKVDLLAGLSEDDLALIVEAGASFTHRPGQVVIQSGSSGPGLRVVLEGEATVEVGGAPRGSLGVGDYFGEISLLDGEPASATVVAGESGLRTFAVSPANFTALLDRNPTMARTVMLALCARLRAAEKAANTPT